ncbi:interferon-induced GTP-binding protein Mx2 [Apiospora saccharicola]
MGSTQNSRDMYCDFGWRLSHPTTSGSIHDYIESGAVKELGTTYALLHPHVRNELWNNHILEALQKSYDKAMEHARFLLKVEREGIPYTLNHYFNKNLQKDQNTRLAEMVSRAGEKVTRSPNDISGSENGVFISLESLRNLYLVKSNSAQIVERIYNVLALLRGCSPTVPVRQP